MTITKKELMVGNRLIFLGSVVEVKGLYQKQYPTPYIDIGVGIDHKIFHFRPIPLTEEILTNNCENFSKTDKDGTPCFFNGDNIMLFDRGGCWDAYMHSEENGNVHFAVRLFYLHSLQNFYKAIEQEDLELKNI